MIRINKSHLCPSCGRLAKYSKFCGSCRGDLHLNGVIYASRFEAPVAELVHWFKYESMQRIGDFLAEIVLESLEERELPDNPLVSFVPLHWEKFLKRGFNQSEHLAMIIAKELNIPLVASLTRKRSTKSQMKLKRVKRLENLAGAFKIKNPQAVCGKNVLLVDDVMTTGSTLNECAKVLKSAGANKVLGWLWPETKVVRV
jgi:ComF family protein